MRKSSFERSGKVKATVFGAGCLGFLMLFLFLFLASGGESMAQDAGTGESRVLELSSDEAYPGGKLAGDLVFDRLVLEKKSRLLTAYHGKDPVRVYLVALGFNPIGHKEQQCDGRTPEGEYRIDGKNPNSAYYKNLGVSYPNAKDREQAGRLGKPPGGVIKIHGLGTSFPEIGPAHRLSDWTHGCIALTNPEMEELYSHTPVGIKILILP